ncbi:hypothetical protein HPHPH10_0090 [Helicobacter pylori Hp H-10]|nr:hypothetical protein HPHPH10_0090 [Helicobacter pylori Hp H-10]
MEFYTLRMYLEHCSMKSFFLSFGENLEFLRFLRVCLGGIGKSF